MWSFKSHGLRRCSLNVLLFSFLLFLALCSHLFTSVLMQNLQTWGLTEDAIPETSSHGVYPVLCNQALLLKPRHSHIKPSVLSSAFSKPGVISEGEHLLVIWYKLLSNPQAALYVTMCACPLPSSFLNIWNWKSANIALLLCVYIAYNYIVFWVFNFKKQYEKYLNTTFYNLNVSICVQYHVLWKLVLRFVKCYCFVIVTAFFLFKLNVASTLRSKTHHLFSTWLALWGLLFHHNSRNVKAGLKSVLKGSILLQQAVRLVVLAWG